MDDLQDIKAHYLDQGVPGVGLEFVTSILQRAEMLIEHPDAGRKVPEFGQEHIRELIHPPFRVVYLRDVSNVTVVRVWRSERLLRVPQV